MSSVMLFTFNAVKFYIVSINEKPWTHAREVCRTFDYGNATKAADIVKYLCGRENYAHKWQLTELVCKTKFMDWPRDSRKDDYYTNKESMYQILLSSQYPKARLQKTLLQCVVSSCTTAAYKKNKGRASTSN